MSAINSNQSSNQGFSPAVQLPQASRETTILYTNELNSSSGITSLASSVRSLALRIFQNIREFIEKIAESIKNCFAANHSVTEGQIQNQASNAVNAGGDADLYEISAGNGQLNLELNPPAPNQEENLSDILPFVENEYEPGVSAAVADNAIVNREVDALIDLSAPTIEDAIEDDGHLSGQQDAPPPRSYANVVEYPRRSISTETGYGSSEIIYPNNNLNVSNKPSERGRTYSQVVEYPHPSKVRRHA